MGQESIDDLRSSAKPASPRVTFSLEERRDLLDDDIQFAVAQMKVTSGKNGEIEGFRPLTGEYAADMHDIMGFIARRITSRFPDLRMTVTWHAHAYNSAPIRIYYLMSKADDKTPGTGIERLGTPQEDDVQSCGEGNSPSTPPSAARQGALFYRGKIEKTWGSSDAGRQVSGDLCAVEIAAGRSGRDAHICAHNEILPCLMAAAGLKFMGSDKVLSALNRFLQTQTCQAIKGIPNEPLRRAMGPSHLTRQQRQLPP